MGLTRHSAVNVPWSADCSWKCYFQAEESSLCVTWKICWVSVRYPLALLSLLNESLGNMISQFSNYGIAVILKLQWLIRNISPKWAQYRPFSSSTLYFAFCCLTRSHKPPPLDSCLDFKRHLIFQNVPPWLFLDLLSVETRVARFSKWDKEIVLPIIFTPSVDSLLAFSMTIKTCFRTI